MRLFLRDSTSPVVTIYAPAADSNVSSGLKLSGTCETGLALNVSESGLAAPVSPPCVNASYSVPIVVTEGNGAKTIQVSQTDAAGNCAVGSLESRSARECTARP